jgi:hypothetical protein
MNLLNIIHSFLKKSTKDKTKNLFVDLSKEYMEKPNAKTLELIWACQKYLEE